MQQASDATPKNGARQRPALAAAGGAPSLYDDPLSKVLDLDAKTSGAGAWFGFTSGGTLLMIAFMALASVVAWLHRKHEMEAVSAPQEIDIMRDETPPPPPPPTAEPEAKPEPAPPPPPHARELPPPPPAPAQAAKVLAQEPTPDEPIDLTGNTIVEGNAEAYAGGFTSGNGTNVHAVRALPSPSGVPGGTGPVRAAPVPAGPDLSRPAMSAERDWHCAFPPEADTDQIDEAYVTLQVDVRADGTPAGVHVVQDPGNGFAAAARRCAMSMPFTAALDREGHAIAATTQRIRVHFTRD